MRSPPAPLACTPIALRILRLTPKFRVGHAVTALQGGAHEEHVRPAGRLRFAVNVVLCGVYSDHSSAVGEHEPSHVGAVGVGFFFFGHRWSPRRLAHRRCQGVPQQSARAVVAKTTHATRIYVRTRKKNIHIRINRSCMCTCCDITGERNWRCGNIMGRSKDNRSCST